MILLLFYHYSVIQSIDVFDFHSVKKRGSILIEIFCFYSGPETGFKCQSHRALTDPFGDKDHKKL